MTAVSQKEEQFLGLIVEGRKSPAVAYAAVWSDRDYNATEASAFARSVLKRPHVHARLKEIRRERQALANDLAKIDIPWALRKFVAIATADPNELTSLRIGCCRYCHGEGHGYQWTVREYSEALAKWEKLDTAIQAATPIPDPAGGLDYDQTREPDPDCPECHGEGVQRVVLGDTTQLSEAGRLLFQGVKVTKDGVEIRMADRSAALDKVARILGAYKDTVDASVKVSGALAAVTTAAASPEEAQRAYLAMLANDGPPR